MVHFYSNPNRSIVKWSLALKKYFINKKYFIIYHYLISSQTSIIFSAEFA